MAIQVIEEVTRTYHLRTEGGQILGSYPSREMAEHEIPILDRVLQVKRAWTLASQERRCTHKEQHLELWITAMGDESRMGCTRCGSMWYELRPEVFGY